MTRSTCIRTRRNRSKLNIYCSSSHGVIAGLRAVFSDIMFVFEMPKVVHIRNPALGLLFRLVQLSIMTYFVIFVMWWNKGYQSFDRALSGVTAKVSGVAWVGTTNPIQQFPIQDSGNYNFQSLQNSGVYLVTRVTKATEQRLGYCMELKDLPDAHCQIDEHCPFGATAGHSLYSPDGQLFSPDEIDLNDDGHGVFTGRCLEDVKVCEIYGWCPANSMGHADLGRVAPQNQVVTPVNILQEPYHHFVDLHFLHQHRSWWEPNNARLLPPFFDVLNYTLFIESAIEFPYFDVKRRNILHWMTEDYLHTCLHNPDSELNRYCPVFRVYEMIRLAGANPDRMLYFGGVMAITIDWTCDLDWSVEYCLPQYAFRQLDYASDFEELQLIQGATLSEGSVQELTIHYGHDGQNGSGRHRLLLTTHGIAFLIRVTGQAGKFNLLSFTMRFGSGLALLSGATIMCDLVAFHFMRDREHFREVTCDDKTLKRLLGMSAPMTGIASGSRRVHLTRRNAFHVKRNPKQRVNGRGSLNTGNLPATALVPLISLSTNLLASGNSTAPRQTGCLIQEDIPEVSEPMVNNVSVIQEDTHAFDRLSERSSRSSVSQGCYFPTLDKYLDSPIYVSQLTDSSNTPIGSEMTGGNNV